ncbi:MAG: SulP family inorganic anion transporter [Saprospiraceae bacterium]|nr:SulP family inorganic anion transporter [Saprospiraceae bacterium]
MHSSNQLHLPEKGFFANFKEDMPASLVVFLVATPLCLGIALASGAPLFSGIIAGIVGGIVVGLVSGAPLGVSGPAAGLAVIVLNAIATLGSWEAFLLSVVIAGILQLALGYLRAGIIGYYFPSSVIKGMLAGIGLIIILKQIPHAFGYDAVPEGDEAFLQPDNQNTFSELSNMLDFIQPGAVIVTLVSLAILVLWDQPFMKKIKLFHWVQGPLVAVIAGIVLNQLFLVAIPSLAIGGKHLVQLPVADGIGSFLGLFSMPDFSQLTNVAVYTTAFTIAIIASLETLLCVEATDKLDPYKRVTPTNRELKAQGIGNIISGLIGGLPVTQVIVRSSANIQSGGKTKTSAIMHGVLILVAAVSIPKLLNLIPLATLAAILFVVGYKLAKPALFSAMYHLGWYQFLPFLVTVLGIVFTDLLIGIGLGMAVAVFIILLTNLKNPYFAAEEPHAVGDPIRIKLSEEVSFLNKAAILETLDHIPENSKVEIDATKSVHIDYDVYEIIREFEEKAKMRNIDLTLKGFASLRQENDSVKRVKRIFRRVNQKQFAEEVTTKLN